MERKFHVVQKQNNFPNDLGEMTETELYAHLQVRLGFDVNRAEDILSELDKKSSVTIYSEDAQIRLQVEHVAATATP